MKRVFSLAVLLVLTDSTNIAEAGGQEIRSCPFEVKARCVHGEARVTLADGLVKRVEVDIDYCALPGKLHFTCTIDSSRGDQDSIWSEDAGATLIANATPFNATRPDRVRVTVGRYVSLDLDETQSLGRCGVGAALPRAIVIPAKGGNCRVWLSDP
jgi:hypothetical protein